MDLLFAFHTFCMFVPSRNLAVGRASMRFPEQSEQTEQSESMEAITKSHGLIKTQLELCWIDSYIIYIYIIL